MYLNGLNDPDVPGGGGDLPPDPWNPQPPGGTGGPTPPHRYNTTPNWQDPLNPPSPGDPYWAEWYAANPDYQVPRDSNGRVSGGWPGSPYGPGGDQYHPPGPPPSGPPPPGGTDGGGPQPPPDWTTHWLPPTRDPLPPQPTFTPPDFNKPPPFTYAAFDPGDPFHAPSQEEVNSDAGHQVRLAQGSNALQMWAASKGTLGDSSTADALQEFGQNLGTQDYRDVYDRSFNTWAGNLGQREHAYGMNRSNALDTYNTNYGTQYLDPYKLQYQGWMDTVLNPGMHAWDVNVNNQQHTDDLANSNSWNNYQQQWAEWTWRQNHWLDILRFHAGLS